LFSVAGRRRKAFSLSRRIRTLEESTTYQYIIEQGEIKALRRMLLGQGVSKLGAPAKKVKAAIQELEDLPRLERMLMRLLTANTWDEVLEAS
jgi:hypothetical protein